MQNDKELIKTWLQGKRPNTVQTYARTVGQFLDATGKPINELSLLDVYTFLESITGSDNTKKLAINTLKSLFSFAYGQGYITRNVTTPIKPPTPQERLSERMLSADDITKIISASTQPRDRTLIRFLYATGGRVGEVCALKWRDVKKSGKGGQVTLFGKNQKTRAVTLSEKIYFEVMALKGDAKLNDAIFKSNKGSHLATRHVWRIVRDAARKAGIEGGVSPHWFRHSHASIAIASGASLTLVRDTLGHANLAITDRYAHSNPSESSSNYLPEV